MALVAIVGVAGALALQSALASTPVASAAAFVGGAPFGPHGFGGPAFQIPQELKALGDLPASERFSHFAGVQVNLKDKDNKPYTVNVTPGTVTAVSDNSLTIAANDGTSKSFTLDGNTAIHGKSAQGAQPSVAQGDQVVVVTFNDTTARVVVDGGKDGFAASGPWGHDGPSGQGGPWGWHR